MKGINKEKVEYLEQEIEIYKDQLKFVQAVLKEYYITLLRDGNDFR